ncbi:MAG TPA: trypsin-like peptidase domain-containing protein [Gemmatirosa sp.]
MPVLSGPQKLQLRDSILSAISSTNELGEIVLSGLNVRSQDILANEPLKSQVLATVLYAEARGQIEALVAAAVHLSPLNAKLRAVAATLRVDEGAGGFERIVQDRVGFVDPDRWRAKMVRAEDAVCRVEIPDGAPVGTGFLVGPDLVLTNHHVVADVLERRYTSAQMTLRFDYKRLPGGATHGQPYQLVDDGTWLVASSDAEALDFALLRLNADAGEHQAGGVPSAASRGWLTPDAQPLQVNDPIMIIQHPRGDLQKFAFGRVRAVDPPAADRIAYDANTDEGSSGSPCFASDWTLVALHYWGGATQNRGIPFTRILGTLGAVGVKLPAPPA